MKKRTLGIEKGVLLQDQRMSSLDCKATKPSVDATPQRMTWPRKVVEGRERRRIRSILRVRHVEELVSCYSVIQRRIGKAAQQMHRPALLRTFGRGSSVEHLKDEANLDRLFKSGSELHAAGKHDQGTLENAQANRENRLLAP